MVKKWRDIGDKLLMLQLYAGYQLLNSRDWLMSPYLYGEFYVIMQIIAERLKCMCIMAQKERLLFLLKINLMYEMAHFISRILNNQYG